MRNLSDLFSGKIVLVAGGTGFLGGALLRRLVDMGISVRATYNSRTPSFDHPLLEWVQADLEDQEVCNRVVGGVAGVLMCAASTSGSADIVSRPLIHLTPNVVMNARMLEAAYMAGVDRFLFISSGAAYPANRDEPMNEEAMFSAEPADVYYLAGWMKRYTEILCKSYATKLERSMRTVVVRPSNVYGPGDKFDWQRSHVTAAMIRRVFERQAPITVWGDGTTQRDLLFVDDFVEGCLRAFAVDDPHFVVNIASGSVHSVRDILETALRVDGYEDAEVTFDADRPQTVSRIAFDTERAATRLGFTATTTLEHGIRQTLDWLRAQA